MEERAKLLRHHVELAVPREILGLPPNKMRAEVKLCYAYLWSLVGAAPGYVKRQSYAQLGSVFGATHRSAARWLDTLIELRLCHLIANDCGELTLFVESPSACDLILQKVDYDADRPLLKGLEERAGVNAGEAATPRSSDAGEAEDRPRVDAESASMAPPDDAGEADSDEGKTAVMTAVKAPYPPSEAAVMTAVKAPQPPPKLKILGENPNQAAVKAPQPPPPHGHGKGCLRIPMIHGHGSTSNDQASANRAEPPNEPGDRLRRTAQNEPPTERPIAAALAESTAKLLAEVTDPAQALERMAAEIASAVDDPEMDPSIPDRAAEAVVRHGLPEHELRDVLRRIKRARRRGTIRSSAGAMFLHAMRQLCQQHGVALFTPKPR